MSRARSASAISHQCDLDAEIGDATDRRVGRFRGIISLSPAGQIGGEHRMGHAQLTELNAALQADAGGLRKRLTPSL
jgi:hypothetical protein